MVVEGRACEALPCRAPPLDVQLHLKGMRTVEEIHYKTMGFLVEKAHDKTSAF